VRGSDGPLLRVPRSGWPLKGLDLRARGCHDSFLEKGSTFPPHDLCLFCQGRDRGRLG
jgi:hypothetical protein